MTSETTAMSQPAPLPVLAPQASASRSTTLSRRQVLGGGLLAAAWPTGLLLAAPAATAVEVWTAPGCGCCHDWIDHLKANGFVVTSHDGGNDQMRARLGLAPRYASCHTALVGGYAIEGHVPARDIRRLLKARPTALGLAVPAMPIGSPGMDGPEYKGRKDPYDVLLVADDGSAKVWQSYR
ncbi:MAG: hypothetical protein RL375_575 [Pseudomonadota bacterium]|jgi:hypothetical protein